MLELNKIIPSDLLYAYKKLFDKRKKTFINCENDMNQVEEFAIQNWLGRLYFERLEQKSKLIEALLHQSKNDWEQVLFSMLLKNFGLNINGEAFFSLAKALNFSTVRKLQSNVMQLESVFFGMSHLLHDNSVHDSYYLQLQKEYDHQKNKFGLVAESVQKPEYFKLRPANFPTIRLSQLANLYAKCDSLFDKIINTSKLEDLYLVFEVTASAYWDDHFTFGVASKKRKKQLTKSFINLLLINSVLPLKFSYARYQAKAIDEEIIDVISQLNPETNSIVTKFKNLGLAAEDAKDGQALLQLYNEYCTKNRCLECAIGSALMGKQNDFFWIIIFEPT